MVRAAQRVDICIVLHLYMSRYCNITTLARDATHRRPSPPPPNEKPRAPKAALYAAHTHTHTWDPPGAPRRARCLGWCPATA
jgi:hypothetical protein